MLGLRSSLKSSFRCATYARCMSNWDPKWAKLATKELKGADIGIILNILIFSRQNLMF